MNGRKHLAVLIPFGKLQTSPGDLQAADHLITAGVHKRHSEQSAKEGGCIAKLLAQFVYPFEGLQALQGGVPIENSYNPSLEQAHSKLSPQPLGVVGEPLEQL